MKTVGLDKIQAFIKISIKTVAKTIYLLLICVNMIAPILTEIVKLLCILIHSV